MNDKFNDYLILNREGIFPGPKEAEEEFCQRVQMLRTEIELPSPVLSAQEWTSAHRITETHYDIKPTWVPAFYRNEKISFWEAAAVWDCEGRSIIQLRNQLAGGKWGFVRQEEVLAHEAAHAARMAFREPRFEEMICYQTSRFSWRKRFGPLFRHPWEAVLCIVAAAGGWFFHLFGAFYLAIVIPWIPFVFFLLRLLYDQRLFKRCLKNIRPILREPDQALAVVLRLTDHEIAFFAKASREEVLGYIEKQKEELRWIVIAAAYL